MGYMHTVYFMGPMPMAVRFKMYVCGCLFVGVAGLKLKERMDVHPLSLLCR